MILVADLLNFSGDKAKAFEVVIQFGAVLAVVVLYWRKFLDLLRFKREQGRLDILHIGLAMLPAVVVGLALHGAIKTYLFGPTTVLVSLIAGGILMIIAEKAKRKVTAETVDDIAYRQAFGIGLFQCLALWPGFSRSGSTISGGLLLGAGQKAAADFTFLVSVPIMFAATGLDLYKSREFLTADDLGFFGVGLVVAFIVAMCAIVTFLNLIKRLKLSWFAYYRFLIAALFYFFVIRP